MKKLLSLFLAISLVFLCSCSLVENNVEARYITFNEINDKYTKLLQEALTKCVGSYVSPELLDTYSALILMTDI